MKNKKSVFSAMLAIVMIIVSFPVMTQAHQLPQCENIITYTREDGAISVVDIDELLEELNASNRGRHFCDEVDLLIQRIMEHQLTGEPLYVVTWRIYDTQTDMSRSPLRGRYTTVEAFMFWDGVTWNVRSTYWRDMVVSANGRLYRDWGRVLEDQQSFWHHFSPGSSRALHLVGNGTWDFSSIVLDENGVRSNFSINRF